MRSILRIFGRSPFIPLQIHMEKVASCVQKIPELLAAYRREDSDAVKALAEKISQLEGEADEIKHDIRDNLARGLFLPIQRADLLQILRLQDGIANRAENVGVILTFKQTKTFEELDSAFDEFSNKCLETFDAVRKVVDEFDELLESGFSGAEAHRVRELADHVARLEYESDVAQRELARVMFAAEEQLSYGDFFLLTRLIRQFTEIADRSDNLAAAIRATLENR